MGASRHARDIVELVGVHGGYAANDVLHDVSLAVERGQLCALIGPNAAGKSTLLRVIAGLLAPRAGEVRVAGRPLADLTIDARARTVALVPQQLEVALGFAVREVVAMGRAPHQGAFMRERRADSEAVEAALVACDLAGCAERPVAALSGGEQQRVHIARALAQDTPILLLDEAGAHLDVRHTVQLFELLGAQIAGRGLTCIAAMHDFNVALRYADVAVVLADGRVAAAGAVDEVLAPELLSRVFGVALERCPKPSGGSVLALAQLAPGKTDRQS